MGESNMRKKIFKKMLALAITASMLSGNLVTAFAQETKEVFEFATVAGEELGGLGSTEEYGYTGEFDTEESTTEELGDTGEISTEEISSQEPETSVELPPEYAHLNQWIVLTDWDDESFVQFMDAVREWSDEELEQYKIAVTKESKETLAAYTSQLKLEKWEEFFGEFDSEYPFIQNVNVVTLFPEINFGTGEWKEEENGLSYIKEDGTESSFPYKWTTNINGHIYSITFDIPNPDYRTWADGMRYVSMDDNVIENAWTNIFTFQSDVRIAQENAESAVSIAEGIKNEVNDVMPTLIEAEANIRALMADATTKINDAAKQLESSLADLEVVTSGFSFKEVQW